MIFGAILVAMLAILPRLGHHAPSPPSQQSPVREAAYSPAALAPLARPDLAKADSVVAFGLAQRGTPYAWAGTSPLTGFDCSGFIMYTFAHFGVPIPHSTSLLIDVGRPIARAEAQPGDIVVFTGTDKASTTPGHAGIVISRRGELPLRFVHASSSRREPFVKVSQVETTDYERRFMQVRRVLGPGTGMGATARAKTPAATPAATMRPPVPVVALPAHPVPLAGKSASVAPLPTVLAKRPVHRQAVARKPAAVHKVRATPKKVTKAPTPRKAAAKPAPRAVTKSSVKPRTASRKKAPVKRR
ncbi:hypothetical protein GCM10022409_03260 [Hymenobacter glaciei]|uniref:NlpC/P60 domain-containing protein n=2 Tax=Hymenobacter glaciei TaxID=877209 RepID=A0ABP7TAS8_9BACT